MRQQEEGNTRYQTVSRPVPHEGVGRALRSAYHQPENNLPPELGDLLGKLNQLPL
ncbi:hypothetical protein [Rhizorhapis suberifaciens]|uniref:hypothetical protein n=1 Tax=Rhizorhapis suberifaciens TaxID=13656 RepID=UPI001608066B|nr:hypothetical protein [Rhizorhapis suberifaciens]